jgi:hypothetical protein
MLAVFLRVPVPVAVGVDDGGSGAGYRTYRLSQTSSGILYQHDV